jgi:hypothetical protein
MYELQMTEELWETPYLDKSRLVLVDHPNSVGIYIDEKFVPPPYPPLRIFPVAQEVAPVSATDERGNDVFPFIVRKDDRYLANLIPGKYQGVTEMHDLVLDLGKLKSDDRIVLFLTGWIFPSDASINVSISQSTQTKVIAPYLQTPDRNGKWVTVIPNLSFPMGKNKTVIADLTGKFLSDDYRIRIRTNMQIYWDHVFFSRNEPDIPLRLTTLKPASADLHYRGFSRMFRRGVHGPHWFDYGQVSREPQWCDLEGAYTRYGDVTGLLAESDDQSVIFNAGDEITVRFDATRAPKLPENWSRDFLLYTDGWLKDGDLNTAFSQTVEPLPFHKMSAYPYAGDEAYPSDQDHQDYLKNYNTRRVVRNCSPLRNPNP